MPNKASEPVRPGENEHKNAVGPGAAPSWVLIVGFTSLLLAAIFSMAIVLAGTYRGVTVPCNVRPYSHFVLAILVSAGSAFPGGWARAEGNLPAFGRLNPLTFGIGGGAAMFLITLLLAARLDPTPSNCEAPKVVLKIGLTSSGGESIAEVIRQNKNRIIEGTGVDDLSIETRLPNDYEAVRNDFRVRQDYDIVMVDDPWVPYFGDAIYDLTKIHNYRSVLGDGELEASYFSSLLRICRSKSDSLVGLPLTANVMVSFVDIDAVPAEFSKVADANRLQVSNELSWIVTHREEVKSKHFDEPLGVRFDEPSNIVELFWLLMLSAGQADNQSGDGPLLIDHAAAKAALDWLRIAVPKPPSSAVTGETLLERFRNHDYAGLIGWANWAATVPSAVEQRKLHVRPIAKNASLLGAWILSIRSSSKNKEGALAVIKRICGDKEVQKSLALKHITPALQTIRSRDLQEDEYDYENYDNVRDLVERALPRPRSKDWPGLESHLADIVLRGLQDRELDPFEDIPGLIKFSTP